MGRRGEGEEKGERDEAGGRRWEEQGKGRQGKRREKRERQGDEGGMKRGRASRGRERRKEKGERGEAGGRRWEEQGKGRQGKRKEERSGRRKVRVLLYEGSPPLTKVIKNFHQKNYFPAEFPVQEKEI